MIPINIHQPTKEGHPRSSPDDPEEFASTCPFHSSISGLCRPMMGQQISAVLVRRYFWTWTSDG